MLRVRDLTVSYGARPVLENVNLDVSQGECLLVTGPSGCGKSTLARVLTGLIPQSIPARMQGSVQLLDLELDKLTTAEVAVNVGAVFQNPGAQLFHLTVADEVAFGLRNLGRDERTVWYQTNWAMEATGTAHLSRRRPDELSGGQKQLVAITAALAMQPTLLVLDEPTAQLDVSGTRRVLETLRSLQEKMGLTIVIVEHRLAEVMQLAGRAVILDGGRIVAGGPIRQLLSDREIVHGLGLRRPVEEPLAGWPDLLSPIGPPPDGQRPLVRLQGVSAAYGRRPVVEQIDLSLYPGDFVALVGDNGAGKSTLGLVLAGLLKPSAGRRAFGFGRRLRPGEDVALLFQEPADQLLTGTVDEEVSFGPRNVRRFRLQDHLELLTEADLLELRCRRPLSLSVGQQQRTALAACLSMRPRLLILDEPTPGQDWGHLQRLMDYLAGLNRQGVTIVLITHDFKLVHRYASRAILLDHGRIILDGRLRNSAANQKSDGAHTETRRARRKDQTLCGLRDLTSHFSFLISHFSALIPP